jgi:cellulose synthase/poly-beta-1,6-N-acetylglucosamine synthase-like glycosyltransferase
MYNAGIVASRGEICVICDSDAMVKEGFIRAIITEFENNADIVLHLDQFRNTRRDLYPFRYPSFEEVMGRGCINNIGGQTRGLLDKKDSIHSRNYGACMCARRDDLIEIGGADEHIDYLGHVCGPYDMTFRLVNLGRREIWHQTEFLCHTWHPGQDGADNYLGPHDGRHVSTTALDALAGGRVMPLVENATIRNLRLADGGNHGPESFQIFPGYRTDWRKDHLRRGRRWIRGPTTRAIWNGFVVERTTGGFVAFPKLAEHPAFAQYRNELEIHAATEKQLRERLTRSLPLSMRMIFPALALATYLSRAIGQTYLFLRRRLGRLVVAFRA